MHLRTLTLRNYRVYRSVDLEFPDGLIGIYGPNGAGKSTLIESLRFSLYGDSRTDKWELRSAGVGDDVRVELVFEHEGNTYDVRRRLKGRNLTPEVEVFLNGQLAAQSVREANAYLARVLGMDQRAFLASVCAQQKELTAFATMLPGDRRRLVLDLLGVSPVERALARVREQARDARAEAGGARAGLPDLAALEADAAEAADELAAAERADQAADQAEQAAKAALAEAEQATTAAERTAKALEDLRGRARLARGEAAGHREQAERHEAGAATADGLGPELQAAAARVTELTAAAKELDALEQAREQAARRGHLAEALAEARKRRQAGERDLEAAERAAKDAEGLAAARVAAEGAAKGGAAACQEAAVTLAGLQRHLAQAEEERTLAKEALARADRADARAAELDAQAAALGPADAELAAARQRQADAPAAATAPPRQP